MKTSRLLFLCMAICLSLAGNAQPRKQKLNDHWSFFLGELETTPVSTPTGKDWQNIQLPHDWSILLPFDKDTPGGNDGGYLPTGTGWYVRQLQVTPQMLGKKMQLYFEGVYMNSEVYVNGVLAGGHPYGYTSFFVDITPHVKQGANTIAVKADNSKQKNCRWYSGSGIYRNVWLMCTNPVSIQNWGICVTTPSLTEAHVSTTLRNDTETEKTVKVSTKVAGITQTQSVTLAPKVQDAVLEQIFHVSQAKPWSPATPHLYDADVTLSDESGALDHATQSFGFRTLSWNASEGFLLNGERVLINGGCVHHDNGILGAAAFDDAERYRVRQLKEAGFNAVRTSHNLPSEAFLQACDELGMMVVDEAFDGWRDAKNKHDYSTLFDRWWQTDAKAMVLRDRNHPSIIAWSIGNEVIERKHIGIITTARNLTKLCKQLDPTRPVTSALCAWDADWEIYDPHAEVYDIVGYNYMIHKAEGDHQRDPNRVIWQTESYPKDAWSNYMKVKENPYIVGDFVWTAMDYIGESGIGRHYYEGDVPGEHYHRPLYPWHASYCGDIDLTGLRKPISHYRSMLWNKDGEHLYMAVCEPDGYHGKIQTTLWGTWPTSESWNWPGHEGKDIDVEVYSHYPSVRLYLNDKLIAERETAEMKARFRLPYQAGTLRAEGIESGVVKESRLLKTAGPVDQMRLTPKYEGELRYIIIELTDKSGTTVPTASNLISVETQGQARLLALGNADIKDTDPYYDSRHKTWNGRALAVVRGKGSIQVTLTLENGKKIKKAIK